MDTGFSIRSVQPVSVASVRALSQPERQTVATEVPDTQAVNAAAEIEPVRLDQEDRSRVVTAGLNAAIDEKRPSFPAAPIQRITRDEATKELVFSKISAETGRVIGQYPDEAMLRLKAYNAQVRNAEIDKANDNGAVKTV